MSFRRFKGSEEDSGSFQEELKGDSGDLKGFQGCFRGSQGH